MPFSHQLVRKEGVVALTVATSELFKQRLHFTGRHLRDGREDSLESCSAALKGLIRLSVASEKLLRVAQVWKELLRFVETPDLGNSPGVV